MKKFVLKISFIVTICVLILLSFNALYQIITNTEESRYTEEKFSNVPDEIQICNFGSSHGVYGLDYSDYSEDYTCFNFALTAQTLSYDYRILQQYENHLSENGIMFILLSNFSLGADEESQADFESKNDRYYSFLEPQYIKQYNLGKHLLYKYFGIVFSDPNTIVYNIVKALKNDTNKNSSESEFFDYEQDARHAYERHINIDLDGHIVIREEEINAVYGMIDICKKHNIRPILITTPYREEYNNQFDDSFYELFHSIIDDICNKTGVEYYDYSQDERFIHSNIYMDNSDHLSPLGAKVFTDILINDLFINSSYSK